VEVVGWARIKFATASQDLHYQLLLFRPDPLAPQQPQPQPSEAARAYAPEGYSQRAAPMAEETDHEMPDLVDSSSDEGENGHMPIFIDMEVEQPKAREGMKRERDMAWGVATVTLDMLPAKPVHVGQGVLSCASWRQLQIFEHVSSEFPILRQLTLRTKLFGSFTWSSSSLSDQQYEEWRSASGKLRETLNRFVEQGILRGYNVSPLPGPWAHGLH
jgi:hypothetical protein